MSSRLETVGGKRWERMPLGCGVMIGQVEKCLLRVRALPACFYELTRDILMSQDKS